MINASTKAGFWLQEPSHAPVWNPLQIGCVLHKQPPPRADVGRPEAIAYRNYYSTLMI